MTTAALVTAASTNASIAPQFHASEIPRASAVALAVESAPATSLKLATSDGCCEADHDAARREAERHALHRGARHRERTFRPPQHQPRGDHEGDDDG